MSNINKHHLLSRHKSKLPQGFFVRPIMLAAFKLKRTSISTAVALSPQMRLAASAASEDAPDKSVGMWEMPNFANISSQDRLSELQFSTWIAPSDEVQALAFSPSETTLACACSGDPDFQELPRVDIWDIVTTQLAMEPLLGHTESVRCLAWSQTEASIASGSDDNSVRLWSSQTGQPMLGPLLGHSGSVRAVAFNKDTSLVSSCSDDTTVKVWSCTDGALLWTLSGHSASVLCLAWKGHGNIIASGSDDRSIRLWSVDTGLCICRPLTGHTDSVLSIAWNPASDVLASGSADQKVWLWSGQIRSLRSGQAIVGPLRMRVSQISVEMPIITGHEDKVLLVVFDAPGNVVVSVDCSGTILMWDAIRTSDRLAVAMGAHHRLGRCSLLSLLQRETLASIADLLATEPAMPIDGEGHDASLTESPYAVTASARGRDCSSATFASSSSSHGGASSSKNLTITLRK